MTHSELDHLELLCEVDSLVDRLRHWAEEAPDWEPAEACQAVVRRLTRRAASLRVRLEAPLVVATLGGTGTGKSALVNALLGSEVVTAGRSRPTTLRPTLICRPDLTPDELGIDPDSVELIHRDLPTLADIVLVDCPDPDTTEHAAVGVNRERGDGAGEQVAQRPDVATNLARLRQILPHCDVLLVATTQQKYRSARVADELATAASGARLVFVQTHADVDEDIRADWEKILTSRYATGHVFLVDTLTALAQMQEGLPLQGEFGALVDLLTRQIVGTAAARIRRANFLDLIDETLARCRQRIEDAMPAVAKVRASVEQRRAMLADRLAHQMQGELQASRRQWESRLLGQVASQWGFSPFSLVLRLYQGFGGLLSGTLLLRARTPAQMALWGAVGGARLWHKRRQEKQADASTDRALADCWDQAELRAASIVLDGYAAEAGLDRQAADDETIAAEADQASDRFVADASGELEKLIAEVAQRHTGWFTRMAYEVPLVVMLGALLFRLGKNFFYDSWFATEAQPVFGLDFYLSAGFWLVLWCLVLIWLFAGRLRRGLRRAIDQLAAGWNRPTAAAGIFVRLEDDCRRVERFRDDLARLERHVSELRRQLAQPDSSLGHRR